MTPASPSALLNTLRQYRLLEPAQLEEARTLQARYADTKALAQELLRRDWLTAYQVNQLLQGKGQELVLGQYILLARLGEGGMGQVFKARHGTLGRRVAVKLIRKERLANATAIRRFQREVRAAAQLDHPHIVRAIDADEVGGTHFFVMEYVEGTDLNQLVKGQGPLPIPQACDYIRQTALGLQHAFERGLVHRDIKPANLFLSGGVVKILDMGLARIEREPGEESTLLTQEGAVMGTPDYIAPEQALSSHKVDIRADLYSLGCSLYFLLAGHVPFPGGAVTEKLLKHQLEQPRPIRDIRPEVPEAVALILQKQLAKRPEDRYQTPVLLVKALENLRAARTEVRKPAPRVAVPRPDEPTFTSAATNPFTNLEESPTVERPPVKTPVSRPGRRRFALLAGGAVALLLAVGLGVLAVKLSGGEPEPDQNATSPGAPKKTSPEPGGEADDPDLAWEKQRQAALSGRGLPKALTAPQAGKRQTAAARQLGVPVQISNSIGMKLNLIPAGRFLMGSPESEPDRQDNEGPQHPVSIVRPFFLGTQVVTQGQYEKVIGHNPSKFQPKEGGADLPVEMVSWEDAVQFCRRLSEQAEEKKAGRVYRLPTEAEWEYACRAGTQTAYWFGDDGGRLEQFGWFMENTGKPRPVGRLPANAWGLHDMHGGVWQWCADVFDPAYYKASPAIDPRGPAPAGRRVVRGGSWASEGWAARSAYRQHAAADARQHHCGFRVVCDHRPPPTTNSLGMKLAYIPAGTFHMGSPDNEPYRDGNEGPQREVTLSRPFRMGAHTVTMGQFKAFVKTTKYRTEAEESGEGSDRLNLDTTTFAQEPEVTWRTPGWDGTDQHPVTCVSWNDAVAFCKWLSKKEGKTYRLPTEAEWEYACRGGTTSAFHFGAALTLQLVNYNGSENTQFTKGQGKDQPVRVGSYPPNDFGLYDMHGNVWEWCSDWFAPDAYQTEPAIDPKGPATGTKRVNRGGSWHCPAQHCRSAYREKSQGPSGRGHHLGFRVVLELSP
jgi:formylglycine-generating enzyme required for sulfatase activity/serine/threonine protein kinase